MMLAISAQLNGNQATFAGDAADDQLWLRVNATGQLEYSTNGSSYTADLSGGQLGLAQDSVISVNLGEGNDALHFASELTVTTTVDGGSDTLSGANEYNAGPRCGPCWASGTVCTGSWRRTPIPKHRPLFWPPLRRAETSSSTTRGR
ncbi:MAG: hypothetical protein NTY19_20885 [Planctomycetota bacterium]|nr:hypothetical protein [Planctomycetota bacterium]